VHPNTELLGCSIGILVAEGNGINIYSEEAALNKSEVSFQIFQ